MYMYVSLSLSLYIYIYIHIHTYIHTYIYTYICIYIYIYTHTYIYTHIHMHIHIHIHINVYIYIYIYIAWAKPTRRRLAETVHGGLPTRRERQLWGVFQDERCHGTCVCVCDAGSWQNRIVPVAPARPKKPSTFKIKKLQKPLELTQTHRICLLLASAKPLTRWSSG